MTELLPFALGFIFYQIVKKRLVCKHEGFDEWHPYVIQGDPRYKRKHCVNCGKTEIADYYGTTAIISGRPTETGFYFYRDTACVGEKEVLIIQVSKVKDPELGLFGTTVDYRPYVLHNRYIHKPISWFNGVFAKIEDPEEIFFTKKPINDEAK